MLVVLVLATALTAVAVMRTVLVPRQAGTAAAGPTEHLGEAVAPAVPASPDAPPGTEAQPDRPAPAVPGPDTPPPPRPPAVPRDAEAAIVDRVVDGDTVRVIAVPGGSIPEGGSIRVRLLNIDAPELARSGRPAECLAEEATARVEELLAPGDLVWLAADARDRDRYDRPLRGLWTADGVFVNELLAAEGLAEVVLFPPNDRFHARIAAAEALARAAGRGVWGDTCPAAGGGTR